MQPTVFLYGTTGQYGNYLAALASVGVRAVLSRDLYRAWRCCGLLLPGGGDIDNALDETEHLLIKSFTATARPILGICRGMQALNVFFGGSLHRYLPGHQLPGEDLLHPVENCGLMAELLNERCVVNSCHHQAIDRLGRDLQILQRSDDGVIEAVAHTHLPILGVQWHPERQSFGLRRPDAVDAAPLFRHFASQMR